MRAFLNCHYAYSELDLMSSRSDSGTTHYHYIYGDNGVVALYTSDDSETENMYYIHTDHLGSYNVLTNARRVAVQRNHYDAWGNLLQPDVLNFAVTARGFTGHEHYPYFKIINMNGRLYDPVIGRFFSPDKYVANSSFTQDFNRYSYARNNPLHYTDPDGEFIHWVIGAVMGFINGLSQGAAIANDKGATGWSKFGYMMAGAGIGAGIGAATAGLGAEIATGLATAGLQGGIASGMIVQGTTGAVSGAATGLALGGIAGMKGNDLWNSTGRGALTGLITGIAGGALSGGIQAAVDGKNIWNGGPNLRDKTNILMEFYSKQLDEAGATGKLITKENLAEYNAKYKTNYTYKRGKIYDDNGLVVNGFTKQTTPAGFTHDWHARYNSDIYLSPKTIRGLWNKNTNALNTFFHEWAHAKDLFSGWASYFTKYYQDYPGAAGWMLEFRAYNFTNNIRGVAWSAFEFLKIKP